MKTIQMIQEYVKKITREFCEDDTVRFNTDRMSKELNVSRALASKYLNQLAKEKKLIKVISRPVFFLDKATIENLKKIKVHQEEFLSIEEMKRFLSKSEKADPFEKVIGYNGSLNEIVIKIKSQLKYPLRKMSAIVLSGEKGTGKKFLTNCALDYLKAEGIIDENKKLFVLDCTKDLEDYSKQLFGGLIKDVPQMGIIEKADEGVLYINHAENLDINSQNKIASLFEEEPVYSYTEKKYKPIYERIVFSVSDYDEDTFCPRLKDCFNLIINMPTLENRPLNEKENLVYSVFLEQEKLLDKKFMISNVTFDALSKYHYENNIDGLVKGIKQTCANANYSTNNEDENMYIYSFHVPEKIMQLCIREDVSEEKHIYSLEEIYKTVNLDRKKSFYEKMLAIYSRFISLSISEEELIVSIKKLVNEYGDYVLYEKSLNNPIVSSYYKVIEDIIEFVSKKYNIILNKNCYVLLSKLIYESVYISRSNEECDSFDSCISKILNLIKVNYEEEYKIVLEISKIISNSIDVDLGTMNILILIFNIHFISKNKKNEKTLGLIVERGYTLASSIADSANKILGIPFYDSINVPLNATEKTIFTHIQNYLENIGIFEKVIILADVDFSEKVGVEISDSKRIQVGIINNVSVRMATQIAKFMQKNDSFSKAIEKATTNTKSLYCIYKGKKTDAIVFTTEMGDVTTDRIMSVFKASIPKNVDLALVPYNSLTLIEKKLEAPVFNEYNVILITGTCKVDIDNVPFMALEDIIANEDIETINRVFLRYLNSDEIKAFNENLLRNFSLENIMQDLTILNAKYLLKNIEDAITNIEKSLLVSFSNKIRLRLYIHISTMVERLVMKEKMVSYMNVKTFEEKEESFIKIFNKSFEELSQIYNVKIPIDEVAYLHDYMFDVGRLKNK